MAVDRPGQVVRRRTVTEVGVDHDTEALELFEVAVDRREVDVGGLGLHLDGQLLGSPVARVSEERPEDDAPRRRDAATVLAHEFERVLERLASADGAGSVGACRVTDFDGIGRGLGVLDTPAERPGSGQGSRIEGSIANESH